ncbi:Clp protease ClpP [Lysinibacillus agricola]|uniref:ATP-dependent Clp protease proteolytic subunit n=1 Tax=Lysinibacillus agricola TaxID=2590012 RepID=A0ABX7ARM4_9BACI|nr:head maturation protease, ClpP-related [Lysinibacillus agricola]QQP11553.1 Clp protease ClpP [Lysinibacillus agricola]
MKNRLKQFKNQQYAEQIPEIKKQLSAKKIDASTTEIVIYGDIGESWWYDSISASDIDSLLKDVTTDNITVRINSPGGDAFDGITIYNRLKDHNAEVKIIVDGWACSAASIIAMAADELVMNTGSMLMIHEASTGIWGTKKDLEKEAELLSKLDRSLVDIYMTKAIVEREEIEQMVNNETWFTADEAIAIGFASTSIVKDTADDDETKTDAEAFKNSVLARFKQESSPKQNILTKIPTQLN